MSDVDFVLALHSHLPWVLNHGRWPHGSDWICEAAIDTYLPLLAALERLSADKVPTPITIGITPVLANQLASPVFRDELEAYFTQRLRACAEAPESLTSTGDSHLIPLVKFWQDHLESLRRLFRAEGGDLTRPFRRLEDAGRIELISCAATHGFLPLLARDESIRLQLQLGRLEHRRIFGRDPRGLWLPECAYEPRGPWAPLPEAIPIADRAGIEEFVVEAGYRYFFVESHLAAAGQAFKLYGADWGEWRIEIGPEGPAVRRSDGPTVRPTDPPPEPNTPYLAYRVSGAQGPTSVAAFVRDPVSSRQVWSRHGGYPGDEWYLEFHKIRWPGGLRYWRVSAAGSDLGDKQPYDPTQAQDRAAGHARHFVDLLGRIAAQESGEAGGREGGRAGEPSKRRAPLISVPFDTELFGHWWFEGVAFLENMYREFVRHPTVNPVTASGHLEAVPAERGIHLTPGSWGANGDFSMWLNQETAWTWPRLWAIEHAFWNAAPAALEAPDRELILAQAAREMLLAMASDWQFIISTGQVTDYAVKRFTEHCTDAEYLISALAPGAAHVSAAHNRAAELWQTDHVFPEVLGVIRKCLGQ